MTYTDDEESTYFGYCRALDGHLEPMAFAKHNGRRVPAFSVSHFAPDYTGANESTEAQELRDEICYGLTPRQSEIWLTRLESSSNTEAASRLGISREAVIDCLKRIARRNDYVHYWRERQRHQHT